MSNGLTDDAFDDVEDAVIFYRDYAGAIRQTLGKTQEQVDFPTASPFKAYLMQDVGVGESALAAYILTVPQRNQFKLDMFGVLPIGTPFPFRLKLFGVVLDFQNNNTPVKIELFTTGIIAGNTPPTATAQDVTNAILATNKVTASQFTVSFGTPFSSNLLVPNSFMLRPDGQPFVYGNVISNLIYNPGVTVLTSQLNTWLICFFNPDWDASYNYLELIPYDPTGITAFADFNNLIVSRPVYEVFTGAYFPVKDMLHMTSPTPLKAGSRIICLPFDDAGYGIISAYQRDFDVSSTGA